MKLFTIKLHVGMCWESMLQGFFNLFVRVCILGTYYLSPGECLYVCLTTEDDTNVALIFCV